MNKVAPESHKSETRAPVTLENCFVSIKDQRKVGCQNDHHDGGGRVPSSDTSSSYSEEDSQDEIEELMIGQVFSEPKRQKWGNEKDFILAIIGFSVDLTTLWRFPYLCLKYGGGTFLIPYFVCWIFFGIPVFYMELIIGQYTRQGCISAWKLVPLFKGVGYSTIFLAYIVSFYYNVTMAWSFIYVKDSFSTELPWAKCDNDWNTPEACKEMSYDSEPITLIGINKTAGNDYWTSKVLRLHTNYWADKDIEGYKSRFSNDSEFGHWHNFEHSGGLNVDTSLFLLLITLFLLFVLLKGLRCTGKVVWFTATLPYIIMTLLLFRGLSLPGAIEGIKFYIVPNTDELLHFDAWSAAATQIFFTSGAGFGVHLTYASFNTFNHNILRDCILTSLLTVATSIFSGLVVFSFIGNLAYMLNSTVHKALSDGPDLIFRMYPDVVQGFGGANYYSILFFAMLITLGIDSSIGSMESVLTGISDEFKTFFSKHKQARGILCLVLMGVSYFVSLTNATRAGIYYFVLWDNYAVGPCLILTVLIQTVAVAWFFGLKELCDITEVMTGYRPNFFFRITWKFITPVLLVLILVISTTFPKAPSYDEKVSYKNVQYVGLGITMVPLLITLPVVACIQLLKTKGPFRLKLLIAISPQNEHQDILETGTGKRYTAAHWCYIGGFRNTYSALKELEEKLRQEELENALL